MIRRAAARPASATERTPRAEGTQLPRTDRCDDAPTGFDARGVLPLCRCSSRFVRKMGLDSHAKPADGCLPAFHDGRQDEQHHADCRRSDPQVLPRDPDEANALREKADGRQRGGGYRLRPRTISERLDGEPRSDGHQREQVRDIRGDRDADRRRAEGCERKPGEQWSPVEQGRRRYPRAPRRVRSNSGGLVEELVTTTHGAVR